MRPSHAWPLALLVALRSMRLRSGGLCACMRVERKPDCPCCLLPAAHHLSPPLLPCAPLPPMDPPTHPTTTPPPPIPLPGPLQDQH